MAQFKVGDKVRRKTGTGDCGTVKEGEVYTVQTSKFTVSRGALCIGEGKNEYGFASHCNCYDTWELVTKKVETDNPRKNIPVFSGVLKYFPDAILEVAKVSMAGSQQHNKNQPLHWDKSKSTDEEDALSRHLIDIAKGIVFDTDGQRHSAKIAWRALANLQRELENDKTRE